MNGDAVRETFMAIRGYTFFTICFTFLYLTLYIFIFMCAHSRNACLYACPRAAAKWNSAFLCARAACVAVCVPIGMPLAGMSS